MCRAQGQGAGSNPIAGMFARLRGGVPFAEPAQDPRPVSRAEGRQTFADNVMRNLRGGAPAPAGRAERNPFANIIAGMMKGRR